MTKISSETGVDESHSEGMVGSESALSRRIFILLIVAAAVLIGQSFFNLANLRQVDGSITTVRDAADRLDELSRDVAAPIAEIRMLSMESVLAPDESASKKARDRLLEQRNAVDNRLAEWETRISQSDSRVTGGDQFQEILPRPKIEK